MIYGVTESSGLALPVITNRFPASIERFTFESGVYDNTDMNRAMRDTLRMFVPAEGQLSTVPKELEPVSKLRTRFKPSCKLITRKDSGQAIRVNPSANTGAIPGPSRVASVEDMLNCSDNLLARAAATGSASAIRDLYGRHHGRVYALCFRMTRNGADAEDLTQEVFVQVMRTVGSFRGESRFSTWLHRLTVNLVLMQFRHSKARRETRLSDIFEPNISTTVRSRQPLTARIMDRIALHSAIAQLAPGCRSVFVLFDVEGYQHREIARLMGCSIGTSKSQLHRARKKLKLLLRPMSK